MTQLEELMACITPLPYRVVPLAGGHNKAIIPDDPNLGGTVAVVYNPTNGDAEYLAHAANMLPKLARALDAVRPLLEWRWTEGRQECPLCKAALEQGHKKNCGFAALLAILREANNPEIP